MYSYICINFSLLISIRIIHIIYMVLLILKLPPS